MEELLGSAGGRKQKEYPVVRGQRVVSSFCALALACLMTLLLPAIASANSTGALVHSGGTDEGTKATLKGDSSLNSTSSFTLLSVRVQKSLTTNGLYQMGWLKTGSNIQFDN